MGRDKRNEARAEHFAAMIRNTIRRTFDRAGLGLHDLAARLTYPPRPVQLDSPKRKLHAQLEGADLLAMAQWLHARTLDGLTHRQADFVATAARLLTAGRVLTPKQEQWLHDLHAKHGGSDG